MSKELHFILPNGEDSSLAVHDNFETPNTGDVYSYKGVRHVVKERELQVNDGKSEFDTEVVSAKYILYLALI
jgi:hypothetical protein